MSKMNKFKQDDDIERIAKAAAATAGASFDDPDDETYWHPKQDKMGNAYAVIRFLPAPEVDGDAALPFVSFYSHNFQGPTGQWFIYKCHTTKGGKCPVCENNSILWNSGIKADRDMVSQNYKRRLTYVSNIYIISDPANPENEGQVKRLRYGKQIFEKITVAMKPPFPNIKAISPFNFYKGANFNMCIRKVDKQVNYDMSSFELASPLFDDYDKIEEVYNREFSLLSQVDDVKFKPYDEQKKRLDLVLGLNGETAPARTTVEQALAEKPVFSKNRHEDDEDNNRPHPDSPASGDADMDFFKRMADEAN